MKKKKVIVVLGPTGSGKSVVAFRLANELDGFLISADSRQVYKGMNIGTNKDLGQWKKRKGKDVYMVGDVEEKLVDFLKPDEEFTLDDWLKSTKKLINESKKVPIIVGGTGLYTTALVEGYDLSGSYDKVLRQQLEREMEETGVVAMIKRIKEIDPEIEKKIDIKNPRRVLRAAEVCISTQKPLTAGAHDSEFEAIQIGMEADREELYKKINKRIDKMLQEGLIEEVRGLVDKGYGKELPSMTGIGYRQIVEYLEGNMRLDEAVELIKRDSRRYAKRQMTWYKRYKDIKWVKTYKQAEKIAKEFLS